MSTPSPILGLPIPGEGEIPDSPAQMQALIDRLEALRGGYAEIGSMQDYAGSTDPNPTSGCWMITDGRKLLRTAYPDLFTLLGITYNTGGEASTEFRIPLIAHRMVYAAQAGDTPGGIGGEATHTLIKGEMPQHNHGGTTGTGTTGGGTTGGGTTGSGTTGNDAPDHAHGIGGYGGLISVDGSLGLVSEQPTGGHTPALIANNITREAATLGANVRHAHSVPALSVPGLSVPGLSVPALSVANDGSGVAHNNMPPYITFFKIIRVR